MVLHVKEEIGNENEPVEKAPDSDVVAPYDAVVPYTIPLVSITVLPMSVVEPFRVAPVSVIFVVVCVNTVGTDVNTVVVDAINPVDVPALFTA